MYVKILNPMSQPLSTSLHVPRSSRHGDTLVPEDKEPFELQTG